MMLVGAIVGHAGNSLAFLTCEGAIFPGFFKTDRNN